MRIQPLYVRPDKLGFRFPQESPFNSLLYTHPDRLGPAIPLWFTYNDNDIQETLQIGALEKTNPEGYFYSDLDQTPVDWRLRNLIVSGSSLNPVTVALTARSYAPVIIRYFDQSASAYVNTTLTKAAPSLTLTSNDDLKVYSNFEMRPAYAPAA